MQAGMTWPRARSAMPNATSHRTVVRRHAVPSSRDGLSRHVAQGCARRGRHRDSGAHAERSCLPEPALVRSLQSAQGSPSHRGRLFCSSPRAGDASHTRGLATRVLTQPPRYGSHLAWYPLRACPPGEVRRHEALTRGCLPVAGTAGAAALGTLVPGGGLVVGAGLAAVAACVSRVS